MKPSSDLWESFSTKFFTDFGRNAQCCEVVNLIVAIVNEIRIQMKRRRRYPYNKLYSITHLFKGKRTTAMSKQSITLWAYTLWIWFAKNNSRKE